MLSRRRSALVVYHYFAHYRLPILGALVDLPDCEFTFVADSRSEPPDPPAIDFVNDTSVPTAVSRAFLLTRNRWLGPILWQHRLLKLIATRDYDVVIFLGNMYFLSTWLAVALAKLRGKRILSWGHGVRRARLTPAEFLRMLFYRMFDGHLLYGERAKKILVNRGFDPQSLYVVYNSLDLNAQRAVAAATVGVTETSDRDVNIVFIGRVTREKRVDLLIEALRILERRGVTALLRVIGQGAEVGNLKELSSTHPEVSVEWLGPIYDEASIAAVFRKSDLCVNPGPVGLASIHALSYGLPVITNDDFDLQKPEAEAIVESRTGSFFSAGSAESLATCIQRWMAERSAVVRRSEIIQHVEESYNPAKQALTIARAIQGDEACG